jgi:hypothetical protein
MRHGAHRRSTPRERRPPWSPDPGVPAAAPSAPGGTAVPHPMSRSRAERTSSHDAPALPGVFRPGRTRSRAYRLSWATPANRSLPVLAAVPTTWQTCATKTTPPIGATSGCHGPGTAETLLPQRLSSWAAESGVGRRGRTFNWPPAGTSTWPLTFDERSHGVMGNIQSVGRVVVPPVRHTYDAVLGR